MNRFTFQQRANQVIIAGVFCVIVVFSFSGERGGAGVEVISTAAAPREDSSIAETRALFEQVSHLVGWQVYQSMPPAQQEFLVNAYNRAQSGYNAPFACFAPETDNEVIEAFNAALGLNTRAQLTGRWTSTATNGGGLAQGQPTTLTFGFALDGTFVPNLIGVTGNSNLIAWLNGIYGSQAVWQPIFQQVFDRWSELAGLTYVFEPNDDGVTLNNNPGILGVRADLRIAGITIDGNSGVLAYNNFPQDGDMVLDSADNFFDVITNNSIRLRNIAAHEHGHGMGLLHVCPINQTKLMEPFISTIFDGPQHDDIRGSQRHYGDPSEQDDSSGAATDVGPLAAGSSIDLGAVSPPAFASVLGIDDNADDDWFRFQISESLAITATVSPVGTIYDDSPQACGGAPGSCCSGNFTDSTLIADLNVQVVDTDGTTVLSTANSQPVGSAETTPDTILSVPGEYFVRVFEGNAPTQTQLYSLSIAAVPLPPLVISLPNGPPAELAPGTSTDFSVRIVDGAETLVPGTATLHYRYDGGVFLTAALAPLGGEFFTATLPPANCGDTPEFFVTADGDGGSTVSNPGDAPTSVLTAVVGTTTTIIDDNFETDMGWTAANLGATSGDWQRGVPVNDPNWDFDPVSDSDGSGQAFLTQNVIGNTDVDGGAVELTSPSIDMSAGGITIRYDYFLRLTDTGGGVDRLLVEINSNDGAGAWTEIARHDTDGGLSWRSNVITQADLDAAAVTLTSTMRMRFTANDANTQSIVEAGLDAFRADSFACIGVAAGACCNDTDGTCVVTTQAACGAGSTYQGDGTACNPNPCPQPTGACCDDTDGTCVETTQAACGAGSTYQGDGTVCTPNPCPQPTGACCDDTDGTCVETTQAACGAGSTYQGDGTVCTPNPCPQPTGACCDDTDGTCVETTQAACGAGSTYQGDGTVCTPDPCPQPTGACCDDTDGTCIETTQAACGVGSTYQGDGTVCTPNPCPQPTGACCDDTDGTCVETTQAACGVGSTYQGDGTVCTPNPCPQPCPLLGDMNGDTFINGDDVQGYVNAILGVFDPCADLVAPVGVIDAADTAAFVNLLVGP